MSALSAGRYRITLPIAQEPIFAGWAYSTRGVAVLRRMDNGLFSATTEVTYTFDVRDPTTWPDVIARPQPYSGDPYTENSSSNAAGIVIGGGLLVATIWGISKLLRKKHR